MNSSTGLRFALGNLVTRTLLIALVIVLFGSGAINALFVFFVAQDLHASQAAIGAFPVVLGVGRCWDRCSAACWRNALA